MEGSDDVYQVVRSSFLKATHRASRGLLQVHKYQIQLCLVFNCFSVSCVKVKIISAHPRPLVKLHWDSDNSPSASTCCLFLIILATTFPITSKTEIPPHQLSYMCRLPFFGVGIRSYLPIPEELSSFYRQSQLDLQSAS